MLRELNPEDLFIVEGQKKSINHDLVRSLGLFNLSMDIQEELLELYQRNADARGEKDRFKMLVFRSIAGNIQNFPFSVYQHFTSGQAYEFNMDWLDKYSS